MKPKKISKNGKSFITSGIPTSFGQEFSEKYQNVTKSDIIREFEKKKKKI